MSKRPHSSAPAPLSPTKLPNDASSIELTTELFEADADNGEAVSGAHFTALFSDDLQQVGLRLSLAETLLRLLVSNLNFNEFMREVLLVLSTLAKCEAASVLECDHEKKTIFFRAAVGHSSDRVVKFVIPMGQGIAGYVVESKQPLLVSNVEENQHHLKAISAAVGFETKNIMAFPILIRGSVFGVIELLNRAGEEHFTEADFELFNQMGSLVAKAVEVRLMLNWNKTSEKGSAA